MDQKQEVSIAETRFERVLIGQDPSPSVAFACRSEGDREHLGTAWLCGADLALTALHVVPAHGKLNLRFRSGVEVAATCIGSVQALDVALLSIDDGPVVAGLIPLALNDDGDAAPRDPWTAYGHPVGNPVGFTVNGSISSVNDPSGSGRMLVLNCVQGPKEQLAGLSGAPVIDRAGSVIGIITAFPTKLPEETLWAARLDDVWGALPEWQSRMPSWRSEGSISNHLRSYMAERDESAYAFPSSDRAKRTLSSVFVSQRFRRPSAVLRSSVMVKPGLLDLNGLTDHLRDEGHLILRGDPGTGKSALLRQLWTDASKAWIARGHRHFVPILVHATDVAQSGLNDALAETAPIYRNPLPSGVRWLVLVDGLDEVVDVKDREKVVRRLKERAADERRRVNPSMRFVLASRPLAILDEFTETDAQQLLLQPFSRQQLEAFARNWFPEDSDASVGLASRFMDELGASRIEALASVPALATLAAVVFERSADHRLPRSRIDLYNHFIELTVCNSKSWHGFEAACEAAYRGRGRSIASELWAAREQLATAVATRVQEGALSLANGDFVAEGLRAALALGLLPRSAAGSMAEEAALRLIADALLSTGIFVRVKGLSLAFTHNTIREALVARSLAGEGPRTSEEVWTLSRRWVDPRWREIILLVLARWSLVDQRTRDFIWAVLGPLLHASERGRHFVAMALGEGVSFAREAEEEIVASMLDRVEHWNPCSEIFSDFQSPNPVDVLRILAQRASFADALVERLRRTSVKCPIAVWALTELTLDLGKADGLRPMLDGAKPMAVAAAILLARIGDIDDAIGPLRDFAAAPDTKNGDRRRIAEVVAECGHQELVESFVASPDIPALPRLVAGATGWSRFRSRRLLAALRQLLPQVELSPDTDEDVRLASLLLSVSGLAEPGTVPAGTFLALVKAAPLADIPSSESELWLRRLSSAPSQARSVRVAASVALLDIGASDADEIASDLLRAEESADDEVLEIVPALARRGCESLLEAVYRDFGRSVKARSAAAREAAGIGNRQEALAVLHAISASAEPFEAFHVAKSFEAVGEVDVAADILIKIARSGDYFRGAFNGLLDLGRSADIESLVRDHTLPFQDRTLGIGCLRELGDAERLVSLSQDMAIAPVLRLEAADGLTSLGWSAESEDALARVMAEIGASPDVGVEELRTAARLKAFEDPRTPAVSLAAFASSFPSERARWEVTLASALKRKDTKSRGAIAVMSQLGRHADHNDVLQRLIADPQVDAFQDLAEHAAKRGKLRVAVRSLACALEFDTHNTYRVLDIIETLHPVVLRHFAIDPRLDPVRRLKAAERLAPLRHDAADAFEAIVGQVGIPHVVRIDAALGWYRAKGGDAALEALSHSLVAVETNAGPVALGLAAVIVKACACLIEAGMPGKVGPALTAVAKSPDLDTAVRRHASVLLGRSELSDLAQGFLVEIASSTTVPTLERIGAACELASWAPERASALLADLASLDAVEDAPAPLLAEKLAVAEALLAIGCHAEAAGIALALRGATNGSIEHKTRCAEVWGVATLSRHRPDFRQQGEAL